MAKYEVIRPWHGVKRGQVIELDKMNPAFKSNLRPVRDEAELVPATPEATTPKRGRPRKEEAPKPEAPKE